MKLSQKSNPGFICECIWVKTLCKSIIMTLLRFTVVLFLGKLIFNGVQGPSYARIKNTIFKTVRSLDTTWNFAHSITRVSTHEHTPALTTLCVYTEFTKKKVSEQLMLAAVSSARRRHGRQKVSIPKCDLTGRLEERSTITLLLAF